MRLTFWGVRVTTRGLYRAAVRWQIVAFSLSVYIKNLLGAETFPFICFTPAADKAKETYTVTDKVGTRNATSGFITDAKRVSTMYVST